jgi:hypothetical protein
MRNYKLLVTLIAKQDISSAAGWLRDNHSKKLSLRFRKDIKDTLRNLELFPEAQIRS